MTKSTITREQVVALIAEHSYDSALVDALEHMLAAMDREPDRNPVLAYADNYRDMAKQGVESVPIWSVITDLERNIAPLYRHAQPAQEYPEVLPCPVLLEPGMRFGKGVKIRLVLEAIQRRAEHCAELEAMTPDERAEYDANIEAFKAMLPQPAPVVPDGYVMVPKEMTDEIGEAIAMQANCCGGIALDIYDAMIAAAPHDTPALNSIQSVDSVADRWIPVSERMPEDRTQVILWDAEIGEVTSGHYSHKTQTFYHCGDAIENEITHWMPPPCAPQEVK